MSETDETDEVMKTNGTNEAMETDETVGTDGAKKPGGLARLKCLNALQLKILAMALMLCDHAWATVVPWNNWMTAVGRLAFPIFAFQIAEGFALTHNRKKYLKRMFLFALISEIPFNFLTEGGPIGPFHQNVMFTFCEALLALMALDWAKRKGKVAFIIAIPLTLAVTYLAGYLTFVDYYGPGVWMVIVFYLCRNVKFGWLIELAGMLYINCRMLGGLVYPVTLFGMELYIPQQGLAVLALIPIWLYNGKQGPHNRAIQYACYAFYPVHITVLVALHIILSYIGG